MEVVTSGHVIGAQGATQMSLRDKA